MYVGSGTCILERSAVEKQVGYAGHRQDKDDFPTTRTERPSPQRVAVRRS